MKTLDTFTTYATKTEATEARDNFCMEQARAQMQYEIAQHGSECWNIPIEKAIEMDANGRKKNFAVILDMGKWIIWSNFDSRAI